MIQITLSNTCNKIVQIKLTKPEEDLIFLNMHLVLTVGVFFAQNAYTSVPVIKIMTEF
jgi:hypothetical protein